MQNSAAGGGGGRRALNFQWGHFRLFVRAAKDPEDIKRLGDDMGRFVFGEL
jgi:hypothetical protein